MIDSLLLVFRKKGLIEIQYCLSYQKRVVSVIMRKHLNVNKFHKTIFSIMRWPCKNLQYHLRNGGKYNPFKS